MVVAGKRESFFIPWIVTSLFICNYTPSRLYLVGGPARLFSFEGRESSWLTGIFATPALHVNASAGHSSSLLFSHVRYGVSRTATEKQNEEKRTKGRHCSFRGETRINLSGVRGGAADYGNPEKRERARTDVRRNDGPLQKLLLSARLRHSSSALFARGVAYDGGCHRVSELVALRSLACSRHLLFSGLFPGSLQTRRFFSPAIVWSTLFTNTPRVLWQCPT